MCTQLCLPGQLSPLTYTSFGTFPLQPCPNVLNSMITGGCHRLRSRIIAQASPLTSRLVTFAHRIEFTSVWDRSFALGCFPPRLTATQFPSASSPVTGSKKFRFSLTGEYIVMGTLVEPLCRLAASVWIGATACATTEQGDYSKGSWGHVPAVIGTSACILSQATVEPLTRIMRSERTRRFEMLMRKGLKKPEGAAAWCVEGFCKTL